MTRVLVCLLLQEIFWQIRFPSKFEAGAFKGIFFFTHVSDESHEPGDIWGPGGRKVPLNIARMILGSENRGEAALR